MLCEYWDRRVFYIVLNKKSEQMSGYILGSKRPAAKLGCAAQQAEKSTVHAGLRGPLSHTAVGIASVILASTGAGAQDAAPPRQATPPAAGNTATVGQQQDAAQQ